MKASEIIELLNELSPSGYACDWDNVGLLVGDRNKEVSNILVALDCDMKTLEKAVETGADMIVTHHPIIFSKLRSVTTGDVNGRRVIKLLENGICGYSMHTNYDACVMAYDAMEKLGINNPKILENMGEYDTTPVGIGAIGKFESKLTVNEWCQKVKDAFNIPNVILYGNGEITTDCIAIVPGSGKDYISLAKKQGAKLLITGDINHHAGIDAIDDGMNIIDASHYGIEYIFVEKVVTYLKSKINEKVFVTGMEMCMPFVVK